MIRLEALERRRLFALTVTEGYPGFYEIAGDESNDTVSISVSMTQYTFTLDGVTYEDCYFLYIHTEGGDDTVSVLSSDGFGDIGAAIQGGSGDDSLTLGFGGSVHAGMGHDIIHLSNSYWGEAYGEDGDDQLYISGECANSMLEGGDGDDLIDCTGNNYRVTLHGGAGADTLLGSAYDDEIYGDSGPDSMEGGAGNDTFHAQYNTGSYIVGGEGYDVLYTGRNEASVIEIELML